MQKECVWIGIGINLSSQDDGFSEILHLNEVLIKRYRSDFILNSTTNQPHINLYDLDVPKESLKQIEDVLSSVVVNRRKFKIGLNGLGYFKHGTIFIECRENEELKSLERAIVEGVVTFKGDCKTKEYWEPWREYKDEQIKNREKYGNPHVLNTFVPHITVGFVKTSEEKLQGIVNIANRELIIQELQCDHIDLVVHDNNGSLVYSKRFLFSYPTK